MYINARVKHFIIFMSLKFAYYVQINRTYTKRFRGRQFQGEITNRDISSGSYRK